MKQLNWKHILIHFIAIWLFAFSFQTFGHLTNLDLFEQLRLSLAFENDPLLPDACTIVKLHMAIELFKTLGIVVGFVLSLIVSIKRKWHLVNSFIASLLIMMLRSVNWLGWSYFQNIFLWPGEIAKGFAFYIINGLVMLAFGMLLLMVKKPIELSR